MTDPNARDLAVIILNAQLIQSHTREREWAAADHDTERSAAEHNAAWAAYNELCDAVTRIAKRNGTDWFNLLDLLATLSTQTNAEDTEALYEVGEPDACIVEGCHCADAAHTPT